MNSNGDLTEYLSKFDFKDFKGELSDHDRFKEWILETFTSNGYPALKLNNVKFLMKHFAEGITEEKVYSSILLNLETDIGSIITDVPDDFEVRESTKWIHVDNANQIGIHHRTHFKDYVEEEASRVITVGLYFLDDAGDQELRIQTVQGEFKTSRAPKREIKRMYGKLNHYYGVDWRVGLIKQIKEYGEAREMAVIGEMPAAYGLMGPDMSAYPLYSLNYLNSYIKADIPFDQIDFVKVPDKLKPVWENFMISIENKSKDDITDYLTDTSREYASFKKINDEFFLGQEITDFDEFYRVSTEKFIELLS